MPQPTLGSGNNPPRVGPVVIDEIQFDPGVPAAAALAIAPALTADDLEFIELHNPAAEPCDLTGWQIAGGIQFEFPDGTLLPPGGTLLVVSFDPATPANASRLAAFRVHYGLPAGTHIVGGYDQHLSAEGELLRLLRAPTSTQNLDLNRLLLEDESLYQRQPPWPDVPADSGRSLQRQVPRGWGDLASSWYAATPTPGQTAAVRGDFNRDGVLDVRDVDLLSEGIRRGDLTFDLDADGAAGPHDLTYLVETLLGRRRGDANLDGIFDSADIIRAFTAGEYEDSIAGNSTWSEGDWNGDGEFNSADFVAAFAAGPYAAASKPQRDGELPTPIDPTAGTHRGLFVVVRSLTREGSWRKWRIAVQLAAAATGVELVGLARGSRRESLWSVGLSPRLPPCGSARWIESRPRRSGSAAACA